MKKKTKQIIGYMLLLCLVFIPSLTLVMVKGWVTDFFGVVGLICLMIFLFILSGKLMYNEK